MSAPKSDSTVVLTKEGAAKATPVKGGGLILSPLPLTGGRRRASKKGGRKSRKISKKALKAIKKIGGEEVVEAVEKAMGGADEDPQVVKAEEEIADEAVEMEEPTEGARRRKSKKAGRKGGRKSRKGGRKSYY